MPTLFSRAGDPQALKAAMAARVFGAATFAMTDDFSGLKKLSDGSIPPTGSNNLALLLEDGSVIREPNAIAYNLALSTDNSHPSFEDVSTLAWLEYEAAVLRPAVYSRNTDQIEKSLSRIPSKCVDVAALGLADCILAPSLYAATLLGHTLTGAAKAYYDTISSSDIFKLSLESILQGKSEQDAAALVTSDAATLASAIPKLPKPGQRNILITSALPYVNNVPHLGNIIGCVLSADVYARFCRSRGYNCIYICGTDEYGTATETKALEEGLTCQQICDKYHAIHKGIYEWFDISFDKFGRTPTRAQTAIGHEMFKQLHENGRLAEQTMEQLYSEPLQKFLADRYVVGTCPKCKYEDARGDQCDACGSLLNPTELINPKCKISGSTPVVKQTKHIFLDLPSLTNQLQAYIDSASALGGWSSNCVQVTKAWMDQGLKMRCITRDLKWGTPVPLPGYEDKVFYVWFDAPIGYISITAGYCGDEGWRAWWLPYEYYSSASTVPEVEMVQFMGKDNVPFHTVIFPSSQLGTGRKWTMMKSISVTEYLNYEDGKFSKSRGVGVFGNDAKDTGIPVEVWRYYLLAIRPEVADSAFQWDDFAAKNNADLNDNLGNFVNRSLKFIFARYNGIVPGVGSYGDNAHIADLSNKVAALMIQYIEAMEAQKMKVALQTAMNVSRAGNGFFQDTEIWRVVKEDTELAGAYISACVGVILVSASLLEPFMPSFTANALKQLNVDKSLPFTDDIPDRIRSGIATLVPAGHALDSKEPTPLFRKITDEEVADFRARFAGSQADRADKAAAAAASSKKPSNGNSSAAVSNATLAGDSSNNKNERMANSKKEGTANNGAPAGKKKAAGENLAVDISRIDLRVGLIKKAWRHPDAESLYVEEIDVGESEPRTVVSGLVNYIPEDQMQNRRVVLVCNLKPANMRGIKSMAMVLAATSTDGSTVELVEPPTEASIGDRVRVEGYPGEPDEQLNPKKKVWEAVQPDLATDSECRACYKGVPLMTGAGACTVKSVVGASIK